MDTPVTPNPSLAFQPTRDSASGFFLSPLFPARWNTTSQGRPFGAWAFSSRAMLSKTGLLCGLLQGSEAIRDEAGLEDGFRFQRLRRVVNRAMERHGVLFV